MAKMAVDALAASAGESIIASGDVFAASKLWNNGTASPINIPATVNDTTMAAAGTFQYARAYNFSAQGQSQTCMIRDATNVFSGYRIQ